MTDEMMKVMIVEMEEALVEMENLKSNKVDDKREFTTKLTLREQTEIKHPRSCVIKYCDDCGTRDCPNSCSYHYWPNGCPECRTIFRLSQDM